MTVTYHDPCHVVHGQKIRRQPRALLAQIPGLRVVDLPESDWCCGSAGIYNLTQPEMADRLLRRKVRNIESTRAPRRWSPPTPAASCRSRPGCATAASSCPCCTSWRCWIARTAARGAS